jgi:hypothetical protein
MDSDFLRLARRVKDVEGGYLSMNGGVVSGDLDVTGTLTNNSHTVWNAGNGGTGSGLDADTVDGVHASGLLKNKAASAQVIGSGAVYDLPRVIAYGNGASAGAAGISLLRENAYAVHFGLDTDNVLKVGGWSMGNTAYKIHHDGIMVYDTGTWGPRIVGQLGGEGSYIYRGGRWTRDGNIVHVTGYVALNSKNSMSGEVRLVGLPYAASGMNSAAVMGVCSGYTVAAAITGHLDNGNAYLRVLRNNQGLQASEITNDFAIWGLQITYPIS